GCPADRYHALVKVHAQEPGLVVGRAPDADGLAERDGIMAELGEPRVDAARAGVLFGDRRSLRDVQRDVRGGHLHRLAAGVHLALPAQHEGSLVHAEELGDPGGRGVLADVRIGARLEPVAADLGIERAPGLAFLAGFPSLSSGPVAAEDRQRADRRAAALPWPDEPLSTQDRQRPVDRGACHAVPRCQLGLGRYQGPGFPLPRLDCGADRVGYLHVFRPRRVDGHALDRPPSFLSTRSAKTSRTFGDWPFRITRMRHKLNIERSMFERHSKAPRPIRQDNPGGRTLREDPRMHANTSPLHPADSPDAAEQAAPELSPSDRDWAARVAAMAYGFGVHPPGSPAHDG